MVDIARRLLIAAAVLLSPVYGLWIFGGWLADRAEDRRRSKASRGER